jgi:hypothetical protein
MMNPKLQVARFNREAGPHNGQLAMHAKGSFGRDITGNARFWFSAVVLKEHAQEPAQEIDDSHIIYLEVRQSTWVKDDDGLVARFTWEKGWEKKPADEDEEASEAIEEIVGHLFPTLQGFLAHATTGDGGQ